MTDCQGLSVKVILLNQVIFILLINAFRLIILKPPSQYCFTTTVCFILAGPSHRNSKNMLFNSLSIRSFGFGIEMNKLFKIGNSKVLITVILPNGVKNLRFEFRI